MKTSRSVAYRRQSRRTTRDLSVAAGQMRRERIDLGLAILSVVGVPGVRYSYEEIAAFAGCTDANIYLIEQGALKKLRKRWMYLKDARLREMLEGLFDERTPARRMESEVAA